MYSGRGKGRFNNRRNTNFKKPKFQKKPQQKKEYRHTDQLSEVEVGITEYLSKLEGFSGIIKARYSDFHVNEINLEGTVAKLTDTGAPANFVSKVEKTDYKEIEKSPLEQIPQEKWEEIKNLMTSENDEPVMLESDSLSKEDRTRVHQCVKNYFRQNIIAHTITVDEKKYIQFKKYNKAEKTDNRFQWPEDKGEYVYFLVYKEALDTMDACLKISDCLNISPANFTYAGVKDRRAKTTQWFCVRKVEPWKLMKKTKPLRNIKVGNYTFKDVPLKLGQLQGNKFRIALRNITGCDDLINHSMESIKENGFINYYGLQRFGNDKEVPTYEIGINLLLGKWKEAVHLILKPKSSDDQDDDVAKAKKMYAETEDAAKAYAMFDNSKNTCVEARLLEGLKKASNNDYVNALENIPRNMRLLYIHSFQSLIWNKMVSKRLQLFGMKPVEGDLVLVTKSGEINEENSIPSNEEIQEKNILPEKSEEVDEILPQNLWESKLYECNSGTVRDFVNYLVKYNPLPRNHKFKKRSKWVTYEIMTAIDQKNKLYKKYLKNKDDKILEREYKDFRNRVNDMVKAAKEDYKLRMERMEKEEEEEIRCKQEVKALSADELSDYTIFDIILPLPGYDMTYPENMKAYYKEALEEYGLTLEMTKQRVKTYTLCGNYRKILGRVKDLSWKTLHYNNPTDNLIRSDFEELKGDQEPKDVQDGKYKALVMEFSLPSASYATMVLREALKMDTSSSAHARLNDYHKARQDKKIIISSHSGPDTKQQTETCEDMQTRSLLSNPEKYEEFKSNIFKTIACSVKRKSESEEEDKGSKKQKSKTEQNPQQTEIKMEASLI